MVREFSQHIQLLPVGTGARGPADREAYDVMTDVPFSFQPTPATDDAGSSWSVALQVTIDLPDTDTLRFFRMVRSCQVRLWDSSGRSFLLGTPGMPLRVILSPYLGAAMLDISGETVSAPLAAEPTV